MLLSVLGGILLGIGIDYVTNKETHYAYAREEMVETPKPEIVLIRPEWTDSYVEEQIRRVFPEDPETAIKIARCENGWNKKRGYKVDIQSQHTLSYGQEESYGIFQIHARDWDKTARQLGYDKYRTEPEDNIAMARYIYEKAGKRWGDWSCYTKKMI